LELGLLHITPAILVGVYLQQMNSVQCKL